MGPSILQGTKVLLGYALPVTYVAPCRCKDATLGHHQPGIINSGADPALQVPQNVVSWGRRLYEHVEAAAQMQQEGVQRNLLLWCLPVAGLLGGYCCGGVATNPWWQ
jgi:hypothetical protein